MSRSPKTRDPLWKSIVWDNHACMPLRADDSFLPQLERYHSSGHSVVSLNIGFSNTDWAEQVIVLSYMRRWISQRPERYRLISTVDDVLKCHQDGKLGIVFDIESMHPVINRPSLIQTFYELGVRWMLIAYNRNNPAGGGCLDEDGGLTDIGRLIIDEMERVGMVLCLSHAGERTAHDALEYAKNPPIFSHSNPHGDHAHPRNIRDDLIVACAAKGGVVGLSGLGGFLGVDENLVERLLRQIRYVIDLVGPTHVGLGLDYVFDLDELEAYLKSQSSTFNDAGRVKRRFSMIAPESIVEIANGLARDNLRDDQVRGILGENWLRVASHVWR